MIGMPVIYFNYVLGYISCIGKDIYETEMYHRRFACIQLDFDGYPLMEIKGSFENIDYGLLEWDSSNKKEEWKISEIFSPRVSYEIRNENFDKLRKTFDKDYGYAEAVRVRAMRLDKQRWNKMRWFISKIELPNTDSIYRFLYDNVEIQREEKYPPVKQKETFINRLKKKLGFI